MKDFRNLLICNFRYEIHERRLVVVVVVVIVVVVVAPTWSIGQP
jgi:hypothetical protein